MITVDKDILEEVSWFLNEGSLVDLMKEKSLSFPAQAFILLSIGEACNKQEEKINNN